MLFRLSPKNRFLVEKLMKKAKKPKKCLLKKQTFSHIPQVSPTVPRSAPRSPRSAPRSPQVSPTVPQVSPTVPPGQPHGPPQVGNVRQDFFTPPPFSGGLGNNVDRGRFLSGHLPNLEITPPGRPPGRPLILPVFRTFSTFSHGSQKVTPGKGAVGNNVDRGHFFSSPRWVLFEIF
jgi:hypothetical protein